VSKSEFDETVKKAGSAGLAMIESPRVFMGRTAVFRKA
jgi:hypothetical protein